MLEKRFGGWRSWSRYMRRVRSPRPGRMLRAMSQKARVEPNTGQPRITATAPAALIIVNIAGIADNTGNELKISARRLGSFLPPISAPFVFGLLRGDRLPLRFGSPRVFYFSRHAIFGRYLGPGTASERQLLWTR